MNDQIILKGIILSCFSQSSTNPNNEVAAKARNRRRMLKRTDCQGLIFP